MMINKIESLSAVWRFLDSWQDFLAKRYNDLGRENKKEPSGSGRLEMVNISYMIEQVGLQA